VSLAQRIPAPFPLAGSIAWLRPEEGRDAAMQVKILQHDARDGTVFVAAAGRVFPSEAATANRRVTLAELAEHEADAMLPLPVKKPRSSRKPRGRQKRTK
jgi:hypothetical protein